MNKLTMDKIIKFKEDYKKEFDVLPTYLCLPFAFEYYMDFDERDLFHQTAVYDANRNLWILGMMVILK